MREPGEVLAAGGAVLDIVDLNKLYLKVYVPENQIGKVRLGLLKHGCIPMRFPISRLTPR
ncbi:HlyD family efflux transporter periplasmic adaptor subunit [Paludibacterium denitrificans]|uniref:HlyD family efflux transporter periplasmic adaptor subunit n=1 Tax=Paludibacterium denitrificans TaxID=2675226 RepID=UPI001E3DC380|nr:HlyD family efflux transporter periplasmic adaptor subunit [Paludibacterium denitrificans]